MKNIRQIWALVAMSVGSIPRRLGPAIVIVVGIAGVVGVLVCVLAMANGLARTLAGTGSRDRAIILASGAAEEILSSVPDEPAQTIISAPGIAHTPAGVPIASAEALTQIQVHRRGDDKLINVTVRGTGPADADLRPEQHILAGTNFHPGLHQLIVGRDAERAYTGLAVGDHVRYQNSDWAVVGVFASTGGSLHDSEVQADVRTLLSAAQRSAYQSVTVRLAPGPDSFDRLKQALAADSTLHVDVQRESDFFANQSRGVDAALKGIGFFIGGIMAIGALFGALNAMHTSVSTRSVEIATLRALGFGGLPLVLSVLAEALLLAILGALVGALVAWLLFDGHVTSLSGSLGALAFAFAVSPGLVVIGIVWACVIGALGALFPALRATRFPVAAALTIIAR